MAPALLQPNTRKLFLIEGQGFREYHDELTDAFFMQISTRCPQLQLFHLCTYGYKGDGLLKPLEVVPSLMKLELIVRHFSTPAVVFHLAARFQVRELGIDGSEYDRRRRYHEDKIIV